MSHDLRSNSNNIKLLLDKDFKYLNYYEQSFYELFSHNWQCIQIKLI